MNGVLITGGIAILLYLLSAFLLGLRLVRIPQQAAAPDKRPLLGAGLLAVLLHAGVLHHRIFTDAGFNLNFFNMSSFTGWLVALLLLLSAWRRPVENLGIALLPVAALALGLDLMVPERKTLLMGMSWQLEVHIVISILAYSVLTIAAVQALLLAIQDNHLRNRHPGGLIRALPPLKTMEHLLFQMIGIGFLLLTVSLVSGALFLEDMFAQHLVHKTVLSIIAWVVFGVLLWGRHAFGWRGRVAIRWTLSGFVTLMLAYFGSKMVLELILHR